MTPTGTAMLMMVAANRSRPLVRPKREIYPHQEMDIDALPGLGVYWDTNILIRQKGDPGANGSTSEKKMKKTSRPANQVDGQDTSNIIHDHEAAIPADYGDHQDRTFVSKGFLPQSRERLERGNELLTRTNSFLHEQLHTSGNELTQEGLSLGSEGHPPGHTELTTSPDPNYTKHHQYHQGDIYDSASYAVSSLTAGPGDGGSVSDYELNLYPFMNFGNYVWSIVTSVSERIQSSVMVDQCYELVVCEAHRVGRAWGESGMLLASGLSEIMMWLYGEDGEHRRLITEAAMIGRQRASCWVQMQQCEDKSRDRSLLPIMATVLERFFLTHQDTSNGSNDI